MKQLAHAVGKLELVEQSKLTFKEKFSCTKSLDTMTLKKWK